MSEKLFKSAKDLCSIAEMLPKGGFSSQIYIMHSVKLEHNPKISEYEKLYSKLLNKMYPCVNKHFSKNDFSSRLHKVILHFAGMPSSAIFLQVREKLKEIQLEHDNWTKRIEICLPVFGIELPKNRPYIEFAPGIKLWRYNCLKKYLRQHFDDKKFAKWKKSAYEFIIRDTSIGGVWATYTITAETEKARDDAEGKIQDALDILQLLAATFMDRVETPSISLYSNRTPFIRTYVALYESGWIGGGGSTERLFRTFKLTKKQLNRLQVIGLKRALEWSLGLEKPSKMQKKVLRAIHHFAQGEREPNIQRAVIDYIVALETILTEGRNGISQTLSLKVAFLLWNDPEGRKQGYHFIKSVYKKRGDYVHSGDTTASLSEMKTLRIICSKVLFYFLDRKNEQLNLDSLAPWLESKIFGIKKS